MWDADGYYINKCLNKYIFEMDLELSMAFKSGTHTLLNENVKESF